MSHSNTCEGRPPVNECVGAVILLDSDDAQTRREKLARVVLDEMYQFVGLLDAEGSTLEINRAALSGAGVRLEDIRGKPFWEARWFQVSRETVEAQKDFVRRARCGEFVRCDLEIYGQAEGEHTIVVDFSLMPVRNSAGDVVFLLAEGRNITAKKEAEAEVARKNAELQRLLDRITQLDQLKSDMFANVSHELRTPLTLILGPVEELLRDSDQLGERQRQQLRVVQRSAEALLKHVNDLLELSRIDSQKVAVNYADIDLAAVVRSSAEPFHAIAPSRAVSYHVDASDAMPAQADPEKVERVVLNLLSNAFKFTPPGGRVICRLERCGSDRALISVQDSGPGVAPVHEEAIFERFWQAQHGTTRPHGGTGLGLAIAKKFVHLHNGSISVSRAPGGGALFQVELPLRAPADAGVQAVRAKDVGDGPPSGIAGAIAELHTEQEAIEGSPPVDARPTVLVIEDSHEVRRFVHDALAGEYHVKSVGEGHQALHHMLAAPPDMVVTDLMLPGLGGDRLVAEMRQHASLVDVPVLVLSAKGDAALRSQLLTESVQDYLTKPFSVQELRARTRNLVAMKLARESLQRALASQSKDLAQLTRSLVANQRALQESEQRWWAIYEHSPVGIALVDGEGLIRTANPAFRRMVDFSPEEIRGCSLERLTLVEDRAAMRARMEGLRSGEMRDYRLQRRFHRRDGGVVWANISVAAMPAATEAAPLLVIVTEDITEQKGAEHSLAAARHELARVSRVSTLGELAASIAHEVNQPLAAVVTNGHACLRWLDAEPRDQAEARLAVQRIIRDATRAGEVITRIRNFLRRGEPTRQRIDLPSVVEDVLTMVRAEALTQGIQLRLHVDEDLPAVSADAVQIQQVALNLIMNAIEAIARADSSNGTVTVRIQRHDDESVRVDVRDTGVGLVHGAEARIFEAFYTSKEEGMGMGLAISQSIVEAHGGRIWVDPNSDAGVTLHFTLPLAPEAPLE